MKAPTYPPLFPSMAVCQAAPGELVIDSFAGAGGASTGMEWALGRPVDHAINHSATALSLHRVNHPHTVHSIEDIWEVDPRDVAGKQRVALAWFSPDCRHFSKAKGGKPVEKKIRGLAWVAVRWAATVRPRVIILENVEEITTWGPLKDGRPDPTQKGREWNAFLNALRRQGYEVEYRELRACDYGAPTIRKRLFLVARCDGRPIVWPEPTHADPSDPRVRAGLLQPYRTAAECIDWDLPCPSIFRRKKPLVRNTLNRVAQGMRRFVLEAEQPFIVTCNHSGAGFRGQSLHEPKKTITAAHDAHGLVQGYFVPSYSEAPGQKPRATKVGQPSPTVVTSGNGSRLATAHLVRHMGGGLKPEHASYSADEPARTVLAQGGPQGLVSGALVAYYGSEQDGQALTEGCRTIATRDRFALTTGTLMRQFGTSTAAPADAPVGTITAEGQGKTGLIEGSWTTPPLPAGQLARAREVHGFLAEYLGAEVLAPYSHGGLVIMHVQGEPYILADIGLRMLTPRELARCQGFPDSYVLDRTAEGKPVSKAAQVRGIGNSVCPQMAEVLTRAQLGAQMQEAAD
ncbi:DNA cytosine methyltransferase [Deinococcus sp. Marseille-Q6407]|uniref:DNA cytosine methyltransferase n=1 Tax=Deinococcus sp. Marseille-Q6407 TaxID=2969223 RepID=UPI0021C00713|nr:DNA cytosine methyltransferase [Deinococcus sp. Marseille-Q6407]